MDSFSPRRLAFGAVKRVLLPNQPSAASAVPEDPLDKLDRLSQLAEHLNSSSETPAMSRSRDRILANLDDMYREAFEAAKRTEDDAQMRTLDFAYRREQLYFEILLDIRDAMSARR